MEPIREYAEGLDVEVLEYKDRFVVKSLLESGFRASLVDLQDILRWVKANKPELWEGIK